MSFRKSDAAGRRVRAHGRRDGAVAVGRRDDVDAQRPPLSEDPHEDGVERRAGGHGLPVLLEHAEAVQEQEDPGLLLVAREAPVLGDRNECQRRLTAVGDDDVPAFGEEELIR